MAPILVIYDVPYFKPGYLAVLITAVGLTAAAVDEAVRYVLETPLQPGKSIWSSSSVLVQHQSKSVLAMTEKPPADYDKAAAEHGASPSRPTGPPRKGPLPLELPILKYLNSKRVILASASPRRKALLGQIGLTKLEILPSTKPEDLDKTSYGPFEYVAATARQKCLHVYESIVENQIASIAEPSLVIAADTIIVTRDGRILEKPRNEADHIRMLKHMRDTRMHKVLTSVTVLAPREDARHPGYEIESHTEETKVYFWSEQNGLPDDVIESYVKTREGVDKAGGYAVQGMGGMLLVEKIEGSVDNVVGLPVKTTLTMAEKVIFRQDEEEFKEEDEEDIM